MNKVYLWGWFGHKNLGDDLLYLNAIEQIRTMGADKIYLFVQDKNSLPVKYEFVEYLDFDSKFKGHIILKNLITLLKSDTVVFGGGSIFSDNDSRRIYSLKYRNVITYIAKILGKKISALACGVGPINTPEGEALLNKIVSRFDVIQVRDEASFEQLTKVGIQEKKITRSYDPAIRIVNDMTLPSTRPINLDSFKVGLSLSATDGTASYDKTDIIDKIVDDINKLSITKNVELVLIQMCSKDNNNDLAYENYIKEKLDQKITVDIINYTPNTKSFIAEINNLSCVVSERLHTSIIAYALKIPFMVIPYHKKCRDFINAVNYPVCNDTLTYYEFLNGISENSLRPFDVSTNLENTIRVIEESDTRFIDLAIGKK